MRRKKWDNTNKKLTEEDTDKLIITSEGREPINKIGLYNDLIFLKVRPYVEAVKQCYNCFRYGHLKIHCKSDTRCIICADLAHGRCDREANRRNCNGKHKSNNRNCPLMEYNRDLKVIMAYNNCSYHEAVKIIEGKEGKEYNKAKEYDRYNTPQAWPSLSKKGIPSKIQTENRYLGKSLDISKKNHEKEATHLKDRSTKEPGTIQYKRQERTVDSTDRANWKGKGYKTIYRKDYPRFNNREEEIVKRRNHVG